MRLRSPDFQDGAGIPSRHICDGEDVSPALEWTEIPDGTRSFVVFCDDPDAPSAIWRHWAAYDILAERTLRLKVSRLMTKTWG